MRFTILPNWHYSLALSLALLALVGCNGTSPTSDAGGEPQAAASRVVSLEQAIAEIQQFPAPEDTPLFEQLRAQLIQELKALNPAKLVATAPGGEGNRVDDLVLNNEIAQLGWTYVNIGDYDQNSEVNVSDITPIVTYFGSREGDANWIEAQVADGDKNGEVNMSDITPIVMHYLTTVIGYNVYSSSSFDDVPTAPGDPNGPGTLLVDTVNFDQANEPPGFKTFSYTITSPVDLNWYWVRPTDGLELGDASNPVQFEEPAVLNIPPVADISANPTVGDLPLDVEFDATLSNDPDGTIVLYEWDWDGSVGGLNWESTGATGTAQHTYDLAGAYSATVRVTDNLGATDTANVGIVVSEPTGEGFWIGGLIGDGRFLPSQPIPGIEVHLISTTNPAFSEIAVSGIDGMYEFTNVPGDEAYEIWCEDPAWTWPDHRRLPDVGVLTEDMDVYVTSNGPS